MCSMCMDDVIAFPGQKAPPAKCDRGKARSVVHLFTISFRPLRVCCWVFVRRCHHSGRHGGRDTGYVTMLHTHLRIPTPTCICTCTCTRTHTFTHMHMHTPARVHACTLAHLHICYFSSNTCANTLGKLQPCTPIQSCIIQHPLGSAAARIPPLLQHTWRLSSEAEHSIMHDSTNMFTLTHARTRYCCCLMYHRVLHGSYCMARAAWSSYCMDGCCYVDMVSTDNPEVGLRSIFCHRYVQ